MMMGRSALFYEDYVLSIQRFNMVINAKPFLAEPYYLRGLAKFYLEDFTGADQDCTQAIERNPYLQEYYVLRGLCRVNIHHYAKAEEDYQKVTAMDEKNKSCWHNMVLCQLEQKAYERADSSLNTMIRFWPQDAENYNLKAQIAFMHADTTKALDWVDRALEADSFNGQAWRMRAMVTMNRGEYRRGEVELSKAIVQIHIDARLCQNRDLAGYSMNNLRGAMSDYDAALEIEPGNYLGHFNRGLLRAQVGDDNRAIEDFDFVLEQDPGNTIVLYNRALLLNNTGDYKGAIRDLTSVINQYPEFWTGYQTRAAIRRKVGDTYGAERDEFKVFKAINEKRTGTYHYKRRPHTRRRSETDPSLYDRLVVEDVKEPEPPKEQYASELRGHIQNRKVELQLVPSYVLAYYKRPGESKDIAYHRLLESLNVAGALPSSLYLTNAEASLTEGRMNVHFRDIEEVSGKIAADSSNVFLCLRRALDYYHVRDFDAAVQDLNHVISKDGQNALAYFVRAQALCAKVLVTSPKLGQPPTSTEKIAYASAISDYRKLLDVAPDMLYAQFNMGNIYVLANEYDKAIESYSQALTIEPRFPDAFYNRGVARLLKGETDAALSDLSQAGEYGLYSAYNLIKHYSKEKK